MINFGDTPIVDVKLGDSQVNKIYKGDVLVWEKVNPIKTRYIRNTINGSTANFVSHWAEIMAFENDINVALGKTSTILNTNQTSLVVTDNNTSSYFEPSPPLNQPYTLEIDLEIPRDITEIKMWHYHFDGRSYLNNKLEISEDRINWTTIFDSDISGTYQESSFGKSFLI